MKRKLPIGIESFEEIRTENFYYVDKTGLIRDLLENWYKVNLFTRPRRFGKSLNMDMLKSFFEYGCDGSLFEGLKIAEEKELCEKYMGKFPVVSITLKSAGAGDYKTARAMLCMIIGREAMRFRFLLDSDMLSEEEKLQYKQLIHVDKSGQQGFIMSEEVLASSLKTLCACLKKHYGKKVILLIDEYDVPLDKAQHYNYYDEMAALIRNLFGDVLKTNHSLFFAVLTGCLRISKESIFTGLNNLKVFSVSDVLYHEYFGFTNGEVGEMLKFYGFEEKYSLMKEWYDGYQFGNTNVYCPWDVINYCDTLRFEPDAEPLAYWSNTSGNDIIRKFLCMAPQQTKAEIECLAEGGTVEKKINQELTYRELYDSIDNIWSVLFATGYLTKRGKTEGEVYRLAIPNLEIKKIFIEQILEWIQEEVRKDTPKLDTFCDAFQTGDVETIENQFCAYLQKTISLRDTSVRKNKKENFYHGILLGLLSHREDWGIYSNAESGNGFSDILVEIFDEKIGIVIEVKYPDDSSLVTGCEAALDQIEKMKYETKLYQDGMKSILKYGIACNKKRCKVLLEKKAAR